MSTRGASNFKIISLLTCICVLFSGCANPQVQIIQTTATPVSDGELFISAGIQSTLNDYNTALGNNDWTIFISTIDQKNQAVKDTFSASFDELEKSGYPQSVKLGMTLINIEQKDADLVLAHIRRDRDGWQGDLYFRETNGRWTISEPTAEESGAPQTTTSGNYTFITYPIINDVNDKIIPLMPNAVAHVRNVLGTEPDVKVDITVYPFILSSPLGMGWISTWQNDPGKVDANHIYIMSPASCCFGFYDPVTGWESDVEIMLAHELARVVYVRNFGNPGQGADWFFEGLAEYVAGFDQTPDIITAVQNDALIPIIDESSPFKKVDLAHFSNLDNWSLAYGLSESLVTFIVDKYGGMETFWALAKSFDETQDMQSAIQNILNISYEQFDASWREWLIEDYIKR